MVIDKQALAAIADRYVAPMTSIRGRRVHRLLMREFVRFELVLPATAEDGTVALLGLGADGSAALCLTDGRGASAGITECTRLQGAAVTVSYDLLKDSLPAVGWAVWHPGLARVAGVLNIDASELPAAEQRRIGELLRGAGA